MLVRSDLTPARASATENGAILDVVVGGAWQITEPRPLWRDILAGRKPKEVRVRGEEIEVWDSSLALFVFEIQQWCRASSGSCDLSGLPEKARTLATQLTPAASQLLQLHPSHVTLVTAPPPAAGECA